MTKSERKRLSLRFPYIIAYCSFMGSFQYWIDEQLSYVDKYNCPGNTYNISFDGKYDTLTDITNSELRVIFNLSWLD